VQCGLSYCFAFADALGESGARYITWWDEISGHDRSDRGGMGVVKMYAMVQL
jgi:hypothetical protein